MRFIRCYGAINLRKYQISGNCMNTLVTINIPYLIDPKTVNIYYF